MTNLFISGQWKKGGGAIQTSERFAQFPSSWPEASPTEIEEALSFAQTSQWHQTSFEMRIAIATKFQTLLMQHKQELAHILRQEIGKPLWESLQEVESAIQKVPTSISSYQQRLLPCEWSRKDASGSTHYRPHGISTVIGPFNLPLHLPNGHILPALLTGNTILFKPSELAPKISQRYVELWSEAGLPKEALQLLQGGKNVAEAIIHDKCVRAIFFTGSYAAGQSILAASQPFPFRLVALEMGGNNPIIISPSGQTPEMVSATIASAFITTGQRCTCARRLLLIEPINDAFLEQLISRAAHLSCGIPKDSFEPFMGPLIHPEAANRVEKQILHIAGDPLLPFNRPDLSVITPAIIEVNTFPDEEIFGPLLLIKRVKSLDEAIEIANLSAYGLSAALFSQQEQEWRQFSQSIQAGVISWNAPTTGASGKAPFGGIGKSGNFHPAGFFAIDSSVYPVASTITPFGTASTIVPQEFFL